MSISTGSMPECKLQNNDFIVITPSINLTKINMEKKVENNHKSGRDDVFLKAESES